MKHLESKHVAAVVNQMGGDVREALMDANGRLFLCGGFIRDVIRGDKDPKDIDIFGNDADYIKNVGTRLGVERGEVRPTVYAVTIGKGHPNGYTVQFVYTWPVSNAWTAIQRMDFTMCQAAIWYSGGKWRSCCTKEFYPDALAKRLRYTHPDREGTAGRSLVRAMNFVARGWKFPGDELAALVAHTSHEVNTPEKKYTARRRVTMGGLFARNISGMYPIGSKKKAS